MDDGLWLAPGWNKSTLVRGVSYILVTSTHERGIILINTFHAIIKSTAVPHTSVGWNNFINIKSKITDTANLYVRE